MYMFAKIACNTYKSLCKDYTGGDIMEQKEIMALLLAGGQGSRLGILTKNTAKPAVRYGGKYRIIDFPLAIALIQVLTPLEY